MLSYRGKNRIKLVFLSLVFVIVSAILFFLYTTIQQIRKDERQKVLLWAEAIRQRNSLWEYTNVLFEKVQREEMERVQLWREAQQMILEVDDPQFLSFLLKIVSNNNSIPIVLTDANHNVISTMNLNTTVAIGKQIPAKLKSRFSRYKPLQVTYKGVVMNYLYYSDSHLFNELQDVMNDMVQNFVVEVVQNSVSMPVVITTADTSQILAHGNIPLHKITAAENSSVKAFVIDEMSENMPIPISIGKNADSLIFYKDSSLINRLMYYPIGLLIVSVFLFVMFYFISRFFEKHEKDQLWVGMSKETAHQLGTPISSLMAWLEILRMQNTEPEIVAEIGKDVTRLETIAERFSKIGSVPNLSCESVSNLVQHSAEYMKSRSSRSVESEIRIHGDNLNAMMNVSLMAWVIENIWKNAIDAMQGSGKLTIDVLAENGYVCIDIADSGKGIARNKFRTIFSPGYTTKSRGWGLGLSLAQRIVKEYHHGKLVVKSSEIGKGTTFRITLPQVKEYNDC